MKSILSAAVVGLALATTAVAGGNLLKNGDFAAPGEQGKILNWGASDKSERYAIDKQGLPPGVAQALRVDVTAVGAVDGGITQRVEVEKNTDYILEAQAKGGVAGMAYVAIKTFVAEGTRKETARKSSDKAGADWKKLSIEFNSGEATIVAVMLRYPRSQGNVGQAAFFADVKLTRK